MVFVACSSLSHTDHDHVTHAVPPKSAIVYIQGLVWSLQESRTLKKEVGCFNHGVFTTVADKLKRPWL